MMDSNEQLQRSGYQQSHKHRANNSEEEPDASERVRHSEKTRSGRAFYQIRQRTEVSGKEKEKQVTSHVNSLLSINLSN